MKFVDRKPSKPNRYKATAENGESYFVVLERADDPVVDGTPLNAAVLNAIASFSSLSPAMMDDGTRVTGDDNSIEDGDYDLNDEAPGSGIHIGPEPPEDKNAKVWIDTDEEVAGLDGTAAVGQIFMVAEVDAEGKPTKWKAVDLPQAETPNFAANEGEKGYIEGRTHYVDAKGIVHKLDNKFIDAEWMATSWEHIDPNVFIAEQKLTSGMWQKRQQDIQPGLVYDVHINDVVYPCEAFTEDGGVCLGNNTSLNKNNIPFCIYWAGGSATAGFFYKKSTLAYPIYMKVTGHSWTEYNKLPEEFLPDGVVKTVNGAAPDEKGNVTVEIPESTGGGVDVTASVGQTIIVEEVDASGKPTKWKSAEYQPRTHWKEIAELLPNTPAIVSDGTAFIQGVDFQFVVGATYTINWNGTPYTCVAVDGGGGYVGNTALLGGTGDTGEPFVATVMDGMLVAVPLDGSTEVTIGVSGDRYQKINKNYLPEDTVYGDPVYTKPAFDLIQWFEQECQEGFITSVTNATVGGEDIWVNMETTTNDHWKKLIKIFQKYLLLFGNGSSYEMTTGSYTGDYLFAATRGIVVGGGSGGSWLAVEEKQLLFRWSDTDNCIQRSCVVTSRTSASATVEGG